MKKLHIKNIYKFLFTFSLFIKFLNWIILFLVCPSLSLFYVSLYLNLSLLKPTLLKICNMYVTFECWRGDWRYYDGNCFLTHLHLLSLFLFGQMLQSVNHAPSDLGERKNGGTREKVKRSVCEVVLPSKTCNIHSVYGISMTRMTWVTFDHFSIEEKESFFTILSLPSWLKVHRIQ